MTQSSDNGQEPLAYTNRKGATYYLHEGRTKSGKPRYFFARSIRDGALAELPTGYEVAESINGVVSVRRRSSKPAIPDDDLALVRAELRKHNHLEHHLAHVERDAITIHQPDVDLRGVRDLMRSFGLPPSRAGAFLADRLRGANFSPVLRFVRDGGAYVVQRMTYSGDGGWSYPLASGPLSQLVRKFVSKIGTDDFFEMI